MNKRFRMFTGPNGSGKTSLIEQIEKEFNIGYFVNADIVQANLNKKNFLDLSDYSSEEIFQNDWDEFISNYDFSRTGSVEFPELIVRENIIMLNQEINSYHAAVICDFLREKLIESHANFSFETVMSHSSKIDFLKRTKEKGFKTYLYFICTQDPEINVIRVKNRTLKGGHDVPDEKIVKRYYKSLELLADAFKLADRAFVLDSSNKSRDVILEKEGKNIYLHNPTVPVWVDKF